jgi:hypothetical protein
MTLMSAKRYEALERFDAMSPELRECVAEFGFGIVSACLMAGVRSPRMIRTLVKEIWAGARQEGQRNDARGALDWVLQQSGSRLTGKGLRRLLSENNLALITVEPTRAMLDASMTTVSGHKILCTREEKHRRRLRAALRAGMEESLR